MEIANYVWWQVCAEKWKRCTNMVSINITVALSNTQGNFFLNGNFVVSLSKKEISLFGVNFEYSGSNNTIEQVNTTGKLEEDILLQVNLECFNG